MPSVDRKHDQGNGLARACVGIELHLRGDESGCRLSTSMSDLNAGALCIALYFMLIFGFFGEWNGAIVRLTRDHSWNPYYANEKRSAETHILHKFDSDFYGQGVT